jgi:antitoxin ParD1/3/4
MGSSMNITLPAPLKSWVEREVALRGYTTASEFVRDVLRREQAAARARVESRLLQSLESGPARSMERKDWRRIRAKGSAMARRRQAK